MSLDNPSFAARVDSVQTAAALFAPIMAGLAIERLCVAFLDAEMRLIHATVYPPGDAATVSVPVRRIVREALERDAQAVILAHNHPGGDPRPSDADRRATRRLAALTGMLGLHLFDHLIFAGTQVESFRALSLL